MNFHSKDWQEVVKELGSDAKKGLNEREVKGRLEKDCKTQ